MMAAEAAATDRFATALTTSEEMMYRQRCENGYICDEDGCDAEATTRVHYHSPIWMCDDHCREYDIEPVALGKLDGPCEMCAKDRHVGETRTAEALVGDEKVCEQHARSLMGVAA